MKDILALRTLQLKGVMLFSNGGICNVSSFCSLAMEFCRRQGVNTRSWSRRCAVDVVPARIEATYERFSVVEKIRCIYLA